MLLHSPDGSTALMLVDNRAVMILLSSLLVKFEFSAACITPDCIGRVSGNSCILRLPFEVAL